MPPVDGSVVDDADADIGEAADLTFSDGLAPAGVSDCVAGVKIVDKSCDVASEVLVVVCVIVLVTDSPYDGVEPLPSVDPAD